MCHAGGMKLNQLLVQGRFRTFAGVVSCMLLPGLISAFGQADADVSKQKPATPAQDPFVKGEKAKVAVDTENGGESETIQQVVQVVEFIEAPHADLRQWLKANPGVPDGDALRAEVQKWIDAGSAEVLASQMSMARSGQRAKVESIRELIHPTEFEPVEWRPSTSYPAAFETRNLGMTLEFDPVNDGRVINVNMAPEWIELVGEGQPRPEPKGTVQAGDVRVPLVQTNRMNNQTMSGPGQWVLGDVQTARSENSELEASGLNPARSVLVFSRASIHAMQFLAADAEGVSDFPGYAKFEWIDVDQATVTQWLQRDALGQWVGGEQGARAEVEGLIETGDAEVAFTRLLPFRSGQRAKSETIREIIYPTEFRSTVQHALSTPKAYEVRNAGVTVEIDPVFSKNGTVVDLNFAPEIVDLVGHSVSQRYFDLESQQWQPDVMMPIFYTQRLSTQVMLVIDQPLLVGIMMPHDEDGQPDKRTRRLLFVTVTK